MKVIISTDAHSPDHFRLMRYGVETARRGWLRKEDVLNTLPPEKLLERLRAIKQ
jgi:DNA polymerase (family 10)